MKLKKFTQKDRYGNMRSFEFDIAEGQMEVPPMTSSIPMYDHPGEPKGTDTVPAWLTPGEFVVNKEATDIYGPVIKQMNDVGREIQDAKPEYAEVGMPVPKPSKDVIAGEKFKNKRSRQSDIYNYLKESYPQLTDNAIAGIMGNIGVETGYTYEYSTRQNENTGDSLGPGIGLFQFDEQRKPYKNWLKKNDKSDSMESQLDFFVESIYNQGAVPNPKDKSGFFIGSGNANVLQESLSSNKSAEEIALDVMNKHLKPGVKHANRRSNKAEEIKELIDNKAFGDPSVYEKYREAGVEVPPSINDGFNFSDYNPIPILKEKASDVLENLFKKSPTVGKNLNYNDGGAVHLDPGGQVYNDIPQINDDDIMKLIFDSQQNVAKTDEIINDFNTSNIIPGDFDSASMTNQMSPPPVPDTFESIPFGADDMVMESNIPDPIGRSNTKVKRGFEEDISDVLPLDQQTFVPSYDPQGVGAAEQYNLIEGIGQDDVPPPPLPAPAEFGFDFTTDDFRKRKPDAVQNEIQDIDKRLNVLTDQATNASGAKLDRIRANIQELENNRETALNALMKAQAVSPNQSELYKDLSAQGDSRKELVAAKNIVDDVNATESEKIKAQKKYDDTLQQLPQPTIVEQKETLNKAANQMDDTTANEISNKLATNEGKANLTTNTDPKNPNVQKAKDAMKFLFGDLIDAKEIGRAAAVYLGSRALGYDHNSSINYVAKQYLKRVDAKTAQIDKYIADNSDKFEATSLQAFKDSRGDYNKLMPKGAKVRSTGERKPWFGKGTGPSGQMAYQFKMKTGEGDVTYWSFDINGKSRIGSGYSEDGTKTRGSDQFNEAARKKIPDIEKQMTQLLNKHARKLTGRDKTTRAEIYEDYTNLTSANSAEEIAFWAQENGVSLTRLGFGLKMAVIAAAKNFTNPPDGKPPSKAESLIPYLEEVTIKERLDMMVPGLTQAKVGDEVVKIDTDTLMNINDRVKSVSRDINQFYNEAADIWNNRGKDNDGKAKGINPDTGKLWRKEYEEAAKKPGNEGLTPYALFVIDITNKLSGVN